MNRREIIKYIAVVLAVINLIWMLGFDYRIPGGGKKSISPENTVAETSSAASEAPDTQEKDSMGLDMAENPEITGNEDAAAAKNKRCRVVQGTSLNVRSGPGPDYYIVTTVSGGTEMECLDDEEGSWIHVRTPDGKEGYVSKTYVEILED